jgi:hypothetical protein
MLNTRQISTNTQLCYAHTIGLVGGRRKIEKDNQPWSLFRDYPHAVWSKIYVHMYMVDLWGPDS